MNFEYIAPSNQVVVYYSEPKLSVLSIRSHSNGDTLFGDPLISFLQENQFLTTIGHVVSFKTVVESITHGKFIEGIRKETVGEGYVVQILHTDRKSYLVKIKTEKYLALHHTKFNCSSSRYFFQCVINECTDDLKALYVNEAEVLEKISRMEAKVQPIYNHILQTIESFHQENSHLSRKDYAIKVLSIPGMKVFMPLLMNLYVGKDNDYKKFAISHMKDLFHIDDENDSATVVPNHDQD